MRLYCACVVGRLTSLPHWSCMWGGLVSGPVVPQTPAMRVLGDSFNASAERSHNAGGKTISTGGRCHKADVIMWAVGLRRL